MDRVVFMRNRLGERDPSYAKLRDGTAEEEITEREKIYADFTLLRSKPMIDLSDAAWMDLQDRRWRQYCHVGFSFTPDGDWKVYMRNRLIKNCQVFQCDIPAYTKLAVETAKQKLRVFADKADKADKVGSWVGVWLASLVGWCVVGPAPWLVFCLSSFHSSLGHARVLGSRVGRGRLRCRVGEVGRCSDEVRGSRCPN